MTVTDLAHKEAMEAIYSDDIYPAMGLKYCHLGYWSDNNQKDMPKAQETYLEQLIGPIALKPSDHILDIGGGNGDVALWLVQNFGCQVTLVDIVENNIRQAKKSIAEAEFQKQITAVCGDALELDFKEASFDHIIAVDSVLHFEKKLPLFKKVYRLLKEGGQFVYSSFFCSWKFPFLRRFYLQMTVACNELSSLFEDCSELKQAGLREKQVRDVSDHVLLKSSQTLREEPYYSGMLEWHRKHYGPLALVVIPPFLKFNDYMLKNKHLTLYFLHLTK